MFGKNDSSSYNYYVLHEQDRLFLVLFIYCHTFYIIIVNALSGSDYGQIWLDIEVGVIDEF